jgi:hypothetical protein
MSSPSPNQSRQGRGGKRVKIPEHWASYPGGECIAFTPPLFHQSPQFLPFSVIEGAISSVLATTGCRNKDDQADYLRRLRLALRSVFLERTLLNHASTEHFLPFTSVHNNFHRVSRQLTDVLGNGEKEMDARVRRILRKRPNSEYEELVRVSG